MEAKLRLYRQMLDRKVKEMEQAKTVGEFMQKKKELLLEVVKQMKSFTRDEEALQIIEELYREIDKRYWYRDEKDERELEEHHVRDVLSWIKESINEAFEKLSIGEENEMEVMIELLSDLLSTPACYYCVENTGCSGCLYAKMHGVCLEYGSDWRKITDIIDKLGEVV